MKTFLCLTAAALLSTSAANAAILNGAVTGGGALSEGGVFIQLSAPFTESDPDNTVGNNTFQDPNFYAFNEGEFVVAADMALDFGALTAGQVVESHYVMFDPAGPTTLEGYVDFVGDIIGVATSLGTLEATDIYGNPLVTYLSPTFRGLEGGDSIAFDGLRRLLVDWGASTPGDYIRVFTVKEVPLPAAAWMFLAGVGGLAARLRRKRKTA